LGVVKQRACYANLVAGKQSHPDGRDRLARRQHTMAQIRARCMAWSLNYSSSPGWQVEDHIFEDNVSVAAFQK
jgi:hypothetical protein